MATVFLDYKITDRKTFIRFVELLRQDLKENPDKWENNSLDTFLEALGAYAEDIQGYYDNMNIPVNADEPRWQTFADILRGACIYECCNGNKGSYTGQYILRRGTNAFISGASDS